jgi:hypothetical protein
VILGLMEETRDMLLGDKRQELGQREIGKGKAGPGRGHKTASDRSRFSGHYGENTAYLTARLARDRPDILQRLQAGEYASVRQAAKAAGLITERTPMHELQRWWGKATDEERAEIELEENIRRKDLTQLERDKSLVSLASAVKERLSRDASAQTGTGTEGFSASGAENPHGGRPPKPDS